MKANSRNIIILRHGGGRLGNQLWLYANVYAFCLEKKYRCLNYSFYSYKKYFNIPNPNIFTKIFELISSFRLGESQANTYPIYILYKWCTNFIPLTNRGVILQHHTGEPFYLPPTPNKNHAFRKKLQQVESGANTIYLDGQTFANPVGIKKYHQQILKLLSPKPKIMQKINKFLKPFKQYHLVGVHIRQGDYKRFMEGSLYFNQKEVAARLNYYLTNIYQGKKKVMFILFSDGDISLSMFKNLNVRLGIGLMIEDLFTLAKCNLIIASKSSFSSFAAYYGNIKLLVFDRTKYLRPYNYYE